MVFASSQTAFAASQMAFAASHLLDRWRRTRKKFAGPSARQIFFSEIFWGCPPAICGVAHSVCGVANGVCGVANGVRVVAKAVATPQTPLRRRKRRLRRPQTPFTLEKYSDSPLQAWLPHQILTEVETEIETQTSASNAGSEKMYKRKDV